MTPVAIVGGGISGLSAAYDLKLAGVDCTVFEKNPRVGGVIETRSIDGCLLDCGPDSFISAKPEALALIKEAGLESEIIGSNDHQRTTYILKNGELVALPEGVMMMVPTRIMPMVRTRLLSWPAKLRMARELLRQPAKLPDRSVSEFVIDHFGRETLDYLAEPLLSGVYGGDPGLLSVQSVLPRFVEMETRIGSLARAAMKAKAPPSGGSLFRTLKSGLSKLIDTLARGIRIERGEVETIERGRMRVNGSWIDAEHTIVAGPAWSAANLVRSLDEDLAKLLDTIPYSSSAIVSLVYDEASFDGRRAGFGFLVPKRERRRLAACTFVSTKFPYRAPDNRIVLRCFFGGIGDAAVVAEPDENLIAIARDELRRILKLTAAPIGSTIARWPQSMAQYTVGHADRAREISKRTAAIPGLHLAGNAYEGIGIPDCIRTGRAAAAAVIGQVRESRDWRAPV